MADWTSGADGGEADPPALQRAMFEDSPEATCIVHPDGTIVHANRLARRQRRTNILEGLGPEDARRLTGTLARAAASDAIMRCSCVPPDTGSPDMVRSFRVRRLGAAESSRGPSDSGEPILLLVFETMLPAAESSPVRRAVAAEQMETVGKLAGAVAHDFNNLLTSIISFTRFVGDDLEPTDPRQMDVSEILGAAEQANQLTSQLLAFSRHRPVVPEPVHLNEVVATVERILQPTVGETVRLEVSPAAEDPVVHMDPGYLEHVLVSLALNAREAMTAGGVLTISVGVAAPDESTGLDGHGYALVSVRDTGPGVAPELRDRIFEPFFTTKGPRHAGLGLSTCAAVIQDAGGRLTVTGAPGQGATFDVWLPLVEGNQATRARRVADPAVAIIAARSAPLVRAVARALSRVRLGAVTADDTDALAAILDTQARAARLLVVDDGCTNLTPVRLLEQVRGHAPRIPVLMLVTHDGGLPTPADPLVRQLVKPFAPSELMAAVAGLIGDLTPS